MSVCAEPDDAAAPPAECRVMIVEDNPGVAKLHRRIVDSVPRLRTVDIAINGDHAYQRLAGGNPDLIILDLTMPGGDGLTFLRRLRHEGLPVDVIVVTASRSGRVVQEATHLGALDYLIKPFAPQRLRFALSGFAMRHRALTRTAELSQTDVDAVRAASGSRVRRRLPKGLSEATLATILASLDASPRPLCADELGEEVGVARVTARRYLEYLEVIGAVEVIRLPTGPGRPRNRYRRRTDGG